MTNLISLNNRNCLNYINNLTNVNYLSNINLYYLRKQKEGHENNGL